MAKDFSIVPDFEYVSRLPDANISDYINVKNFFKRITLKQDVYQDLSFFTKYKIRGDDRPDNVAFKEYGRSDLDWIVLTSNNILNIQSEWPMPQFEFDKYLIEKYGTYDNLNNTHHHETTELKNNDNVIIVQKGLRVDSNYSITYFEDSGMVTQNPVVEVTNYQYEEQLNDSKRNIFLLKDIYLNVIIDDFQDLMTYKKGSSQYKTETLKTADNIRLF